MSRSNQALRIGIIGYGVVGKKRYSILKKYNKFRVVAASDINEQALGDLPKSICRFSEYRELIEKGNCSIVFISLPNRFAADATRLSLQKGIHVFCEKPPARSSKELVRIRKFIAGTNLKLKYGFNHRYHSSILKASEIIASDSLGKIVAMRGIYGKSNIISFDQSDWRSRRSEAGGGILLDQGIHMLDLMLFFAKEKFKNIFSIIKNDFWRHDVEDNAFVLMESHSGIVAQLHSSATQWRHKFNLEIILEKGALVFGGLLTGSKSYGDETLTVIRAKPDSDRGLPKEKKYQFSKDISWAEEIKEFLNAIEHNTEVLHGTYDEALMIMKLIEQIYKSDRQWAEKYYNK